MKIARADVIPYALPLCRALPGLSSIVRNGLLLRLQSADGATAYGDVAPLPGVSHESMAEAGAQLRSLLGLLCGDWPAEPLAILQTYASRFPSELAPSVRFGLESALLNLCGVGGGIPWHRALNRPCLDEVPVCALASGSTGEWIVTARRAAAEGYTCIKIKVGKRLAAVSPSSDMESRLMEGETAASRPNSTLDDAAAVCAVQAACGGALRLRIDANRAWSLAEARAFVTAVASCNIEYFEEPLREPNQYASLRAGCGFKIALDETIRASGGQPAEWPGGDVWIIKPTRCGGIAATLALAARARVGNSDVVISSTFESSVGLRTLCQLAALTQTPGMAAGLGTAGWFQADVLREPFRVTHGRVNVDAMAASSVELDEALHG